jgi:hypothetical protein
MKLRTLSTCAACFIVFGIKVVTQRWHLTGHTKADADGYYKGLMYPTSHNNVILNAAWLSVASGIYAVSRNHYDLALACFAIWLTSVIYWWKPKPQSWRRYMDITGVACALSYHMMRSIGAEHMIEYYIALACGFVCYPLSGYFHNRNSWLSATFHAGVHLFGNISNFVLYSGALRSLAH